MGDRYRYARPRSPVLYNPARASLPINVSGYSPLHSDHHMHVVPSSRREIILGPRSSTSAIATNGPTTTTTYKISPEPARGSSVREGSRTRRSTLDTNSRPTVPTIVTAAPRHRPIVHSGSARPSSPMVNPYRSSEEEYYAIPGTSHHGHHHHHHQKRYSATMDNADMNRLARERDSSRLRTGGVREVAYTGTRNRNSYTGALVPHRHADTGEEYGDNGYGYTNPRELVQYDLSNTAPPARHHSRRDSFEGGRSGRPNSITGSNDLIPRSYDARERGPPPSTRGFDRISARPAPAAPYDWEKPRIAVAPMEPIQRPARVEPPFEGLKAEPERRGSSRTRRPVSVYHDRERRPQREEYYERDDEPRHREREKERDRDRERERERERPHRHDQYVDDVDNRGFGIRPERSDKTERSERSERSQRPEKSERSDRAERNDRSERPERSDRSERREKDDKHDHKSGRDALATGLSLAGAALGVKAFKDAGKDDERDDRDEPRRRRDKDYDDEPRRHRDSRDERESIDTTTGRDPRDSRRSRDPDLKARGPSDESLGSSGREPKERREDRESDPERPPRRHRPEIVTAAAVSRDESSASDEATPRSRRPRRESGTTAQPFDPKNTMDLKALKDALNAQTPTTPKDPASAHTPIRTPRESMNKDPREVADIRSSLNSQSRVLRIVTPPPQANSSSAPVKSILRQPREKFPEDPAPIREGVAPLKDAKKDGVPPDARWTKISRKLVNPEALEAGKERYEAREDFVIVLRVLSRDEVQQYAEVTERIRAAREEIEEQEERDARRRARRERHERHKRERSERGEREPSRDERRERHRRRERKEKVDDSESDTSEDEYDKPKMLEGPVMSGGLGTGDAKPQSSVSGVR